MPYSPVDTLHEDPITHLNVEAQLTAMQEQTRVTPVEAQLVGHSAVESAVQIAEVAEARVRPPEAGAKEVAVETWHAFNPFNTENAPMFGGEAERAQAAKTVRNIAGQATLTGKFFDGRHKRLTKDLEAGTITQQQHDYEVGAILTGLALTNPEHLRNVAEAQRNAIDRRVKAGALPPETKFVDVVSRTTENGVELAGIDKVVANMTGATTQQELAANGLSLKKEYYTQDNLIKATARHDAQQAKLAAAKAEDQAKFEAEVRRTIDLLDEEEHKVKA